MGFYVENVVKGRIAETIAEELLRELGFFVLKLGQEHTVSPLTQMQKLLDSGKFSKSKIIGQIHDSLVCSVHPDEQDEFDEVLRELATTTLRENFPWINVPMTLEKEMGEIDGDWTTIQEDETFIKKVSIKSSL